MRLPEWAAGREGSGVDVRILGPLEIIDGGRDVTPRRAKARAALAFHGAARQRALAPERMLDALSGGRAAENCGQGLQGQ